MHTRMGARTHTYTGIKLHYHIKQHIGINWVKLVVKNSLHVHPYMIKVKVQIKSALYLLISLLSTEGSQKKREKTRDVNIHENWGFE